MRRADCYRFRVEANAPPSGAAHATAALAPARLPVQRPSDARLLVIGAHGELAHHRRADWIDPLGPDDVVVFVHTGGTPANFTWSDLWIGEPRESS